MCLRLPVGLRHCSLPGARTSNAAVVSGAIASLATLIRPNLAPLAGLIAAARSSARRRPPASALLCRGARSRTRAARLDTVRPLRLSLRLGIWNVGRRVLAPEYRAEPLALSAMDYRTHTASSGCHSRRRSGSRDMPAALFSRGRVDARGSTWLAYLPVRLLPTARMVSTRGFCSSRSPIMLMFASAVAASRRSAACRRRWRMQAMALMLVGLARHVDSHGRQPRRVPAPRSGAEISTGGCVRARQAPVHRVRAGNAAQWKHPLLRQSSGAAVGSARAVASRRVLASLRAHGHEPFLVVDEGEYAVFRARFEGGGQKAVRADLSRWRCWEIHESLRFVIRPGAPIAASET